MDVLSDILRSLRFEGTIFFRSDLSRHWGMSLDMTHEPRFHIILDGSCWFQAPSMDCPIQLRAGDVLVLSHGDEHWIADSPTSPLIPSAQVVDAYERGASFFQGDDVVTRLLCGLFRFDTSLLHPLISILPSIIHVGAGPASEQVNLPHTLAWIDQERLRLDSGSSVVVDRLCEILFIQIIRIHQTFASHTPSMLEALSDPIVGQALQLIHDQPKHPWTLEQIARGVGASRAVLADRFSRLVGMPPKTYLTAWRMQKAASLLQDARHSLLDVAIEVGYRSDAAFSKAFKRFFGENPSVVRYENRGRTKSPER